MTIGGEIRNRITSEASRPTSGASVAAFRVAFGVVALVAIGRLFANGWIDDLYIEPVHRFAYPGFGWVMPLPGWGMYLHFAALGVLAMCIAAGYRYRLCVVLFFVGFTYSELIDRTIYLNHHYWMILAAFLMIFLPLGRVYSVDAWRNRSMQDAVIRRDTVQAWVLWALRAQVGVVYVFAGIAKLNPDWLIHAQPLRIWLYQHGDMPIVGALPQELWVAYAMSWAGAAFDLTIVGWLLWHRTRLWAYITLVVFHLATWMLFPKLGIFPWLMIAGATVFLRPDWPLLLLRSMPLQWIPLQWLIYRVALRGEDAGISENPSADPSDGILATAQANANGQECRQVRLSWAARATIVVLAIFAVAQVALPLRHFAYPGNVRWTEAGYLFAWRVMLTEKTGLVHYHVRDLDGGKAWLITPDDYLTPLQVERMAFQPDLILQTAHFIADDFAMRGYNGVAVNAEAFVAWNGRPHGRLINPEADLASVKSGSMPNKWILPYEN
ncbi:MAG: HTTM domain-containing protein [Chloroflexota bacterium]|nr:HTTM domain-containing protein [Chloroflexota bacterium]